MGGCWRFEGFERTLDGLEFREQSSLLRGENAGSLAFHELSVVKRSLVGEFGGIVMDVGLGAVFQCPDDLHVRVAGVVDVCGSECVGVDVVWFFDADCCEAAQWWSGVAGDFFC